VGARRAQPGVGAESACQSKKSTPRQRSPGGAAGGRGGFSPLRRQAGKKAPTRERDRRPNPQAGFPARDVNATGEGAAPGGPGRGDRKRCRAAGDLKQTASESMV